MAYRVVLSQSQHDAVIRASQGTYSELVKQGYRVAINPNGEKNQSVGPGGQNYPDLIVWRPSPQDPNSGTAIIIEEIETEDSVSPNEVQQWRDYGALGVKFFLIVPQSRVVYAHQLVVQNNIAVTEIWYYTPAGSSYVFTKYITLR